MVLLVAHLLPSPKIKTMNNRNQKTVVFITGAFVTHHCWENWVPYFENLGYKVIVPPWPHKNADAQTLRNQQPNNLIAENRLSDLIDYFEEIVKSQPSKPLLIGHSIGGLITQILVAQGLAAAGVAIHSVPPQGVLTFKFSFLKAGWGPLGFFTPTSKPFMMSFAQWQYAFTNSMTLDEQKESYYQFAIPESKLIVRDTITSVAAVDFKKPHAPLLFLAGSKDHTIPASLNRDNYKRYTDLNSITDYKEFDFAPHIVIAHPRWKEQADYIQQWLRLNQL
jgi:pimeloyl-ACP methyl ester carboxylesterase